ncbi:RuBisCO large subunit-binding protein subunit beta, chloroplastic [Tanacetum coccineum]
MEPRYSNVSCNNDVEDDNSHSTRRNCNKKGGRVTLENTWNEVLGLAVNRVLTKDTTTIDAKEDYGKEKLNERIARFSGEVAVIQRIYYYSSFCRTFRARNKELMTVVDVDSPKDMKLPQLHSLSNNLNIEYGELNRVVFGLLRYVNKYV